jgi:hypothetical protein
MYHLFMHGRYDFWEHYHKRSNIETAHSMTKGKFESHLRSKSETGQINEALCKVLLASAAGSSPRSQWIVHTLFRTCSCTASLMACAWSSS